MAITRPCALQDPKKVKRIVDAYFSDREKQQEVRELKNGDKRVYRIPPSIWALSRLLGITDDTFRRYVDEDYTQDRDAYNTETQKEICSILADAKERIIQELYEGVQLGYWNERVSMAQLQKFGVIGSESDSRDVKVIIQGSNTWSE